ncbi:MAG: hypothetical protein JW909_00270 [Planctomycetes bacterium]|nr:hypothetical protein [Planctomycetota bacterium]
MAGERIFENHVIRRRIDVPAIWDFALGPREVYPVPLDTPHGPEDISGGSAPPPFRGDEATELPSGYPHKMPVPGVWETSETGRFHRGRAYYRTAFMLDEAARVRLYFGGVSHTAWVYVDGEYADSHYNAFTAFEIVTGVLDAGEHVVEMEVSNGFSPESTLHTPQDYFTYGGINRPVVIETLPDIYIDRVEVETIELLETKARLRVAVELANAGKESGSVPLGADIPEAGIHVDFGETAVEPGGKTRVEREVTVPEPRRWGMFSGELYTIDVTTGEDDLIDRFGIRTVRVSGTDILLNGEAVRLWGFNRHEDHPEFGCALPLPAQYEDMRILLESGANFLRTSHYPNDPRTLDICDELGILVWEESHQRGLRIAGETWQPSMATMGLPKFMPQAVQCHREMLAQHYNHPSIIIWAHLNECAEAEEPGVSMFRELYDELKKDPSRPCTHASCYPWNGRALEFGDILSINAYLGWYGDSYENWTRYIDRLLPYQEKNLGVTPRPFIMSEFGAGAIRGFRAEHRPKWSEEYQADLLDRTLEQLVAHPRVNGMAIWQFCDVRVDDYVAIRRPRTMNNKGVVDENRRLKLAFDVVKKHYSALKKAYLESRP